MSDIIDKEKIVELTTDVVAAFVSNNPLPGGELANTISDVYSALSNLDGDSEAVLPPEEPAVPIKQSRKPEYLVCLCCGLKFKSLKRHLRTAHDLSPDAYRAKWGLAPDYPMVADNYAKRRSQLAKEIGLGRRA